MQFSLFLFLNFLFPLKGDTLVETTQKRLRIKSNHTSSIDIITDSSMTIGSKPTLTAPLEQSNEVVSASLNNHLPNAAKYRY